MNVMVTGGAGFIGSHIVDLLIEKGYSVVIIDDLSTGKMENINKEAEFYKIGIQSDELYKIFQKKRITHIIHQAAQVDVQSSLNNPLFDADINICGTINLLECCRKYGVKKIVYASSAAVYGEPEYLPIDEDHPVQPLSPYGISKYTPEHYITMYHKIYGIEYTILRYSNVFGPRQSAEGEGGVISIFVDRMLADKRPVIYGDGSQSRDFIFVKDVAAANIKSLEKGNGRIMNISCCKKHTIHELVSYLNKALDKKLNTEYRKERTGDIRHSLLDNNLAHNYLNWNPRYKFYEGLQETVNYYRI
ncbi:MAG: SDR family oxidoreductase [Halanaerobiaceae bacterium]